MTMIICPRPSLSPPSPTECNGRHITLFFVTRIGFENSRSTNSVLLQSVIQ